MLGRGHLHTVLTVARKELRETLRDRQTALTTLVLPLCLYPLLFWVMVQGALVVQGHRETQEVQLGHVGEAPADALAAIAGEDGLEPVVLHELTEVAPTATVEELGDLLEEASGADLDGILSFEEQGVRLVVDRASPHGDLAARRVRERLGSLQGERRASALREQGEDPQRLDRLRLEQVDVGDESDKGALVLATILPLILATWCFLGALFPAIDLSAGERERSTLETTALLPVPRAWLLEGKVLAVATLAVLATTANLIAIALSAEGLLRQIDPNGRLLVAFPTAALVAAAPMVMLLALLCAGLLTALAGLARNFREAQASLGPLQILFVLPAMAAILPGVELTPGLALVPVLGATLATKSLILGQVLLLEYALTITSLLLYAWLALRFSLRLMSREGYATSSATITWKEALRMLRSSRPTAP